MSNTYSLNKIQNNIIKSFNQILKCYSYDLSSLRIWMEILNKANNILLNHVSTILKKTEIEPIRPGLLSPLQHQTTTLISTSVKSSSKAKLSSTNKHLKSNPSRTSMLLAASWILFSKYHLTSNLISFTFSFPCSQKKTKLL